MMIVLEGPDFAGKTTLAETLMARAPAPCRLVHCGPPKIDPFFEYLNHVLCARDAWINDGVVTIFDRFHLGQPTYGVVCRGEKPGNRWRRLLERLMLSLGAVLVPCYISSEEKFIKTWNGQDTEKEYETDLYRMLEIRQRFIELFNYDQLDVYRPRGRCHLPKTMIYDWTSMSSSKTVVQERVTNHIWATWKTVMGGFLDEADPFNPDFYSLGTSHARTWIIGDRPRSSNNELSLPLPFFQRTHSGGLILKACEQARVGEEHLAFFNAWHEDGIPTSARDVQKVLGNPPQRVILLGKEAAKWWHNHTPWRRDTRGLAHPAYVRRFEHRRLTAYVDELARHLMDVHLHQPYERR